jgi:uncharacterized protein (DUF1778 family)
MKENINTSNMNKDKMIMIRVTEQEKKRLQDKAKEDNRTLSNYLITKGLKDAR